jgi:fructosamine-3-kinase
MRTSEQMLHLSSNLAEELSAYTRQRRSTFYPKTDIPFPDDVLRSLRFEEAALRPEVVMDLCRQVMGQEPLSAHLLPHQGTFHRLYRVACDGSPAVIVRFNVVSQWGRDFQLLLDRWVMDQLASQGLPALQVYKVDLSRRLCPWDYEIMEEAQGTSLRDVDHDELRMQALLRELGRLVARLHGIGTERFGWPDVSTLVASADGPFRLCGIFESWRDYILVNLDEHVQTCEALGTIGPSEKCQIRSAFADLDYLLTDVRPVLLHGDLGSHNVFTRDGAITALLDWEDCLSGDPLFDIAFWATFHPDERHEPFFEGYRSERSLPEDFELRFWFYYLRVALSKTVHRHRFGYTDQRGRMPASRRIHKALARIQQLSTSRRKSPATL